MSTKKKAGDIPPLGGTATGGPPDLPTLLAHPAVKNWLRKRLESSDAEVRLGPGGSWAYNETKRGDVQAVNDFLHAVADLG